MKRVPPITDLEPRNDASPFSQHHLYKVHLGNGRHVFFSSRRDAAAYSSDTRRFLHQLMLEANTLLGEALQDHRSAWPILGDLQAKELANVDRELRELLQLATTSLDKGTPERAGPDGNYHAWRHVRTTFEVLQKVFTTLETVYQYKTIPVLRWRLAMRAQQCVHALDRLQDYGAVPTFGKAGH